MRSGCSRSVALTGAGRCSPRHPGGGRRVARPLPAGRKADGDPFAGGRLEALVSQAEFTDGRAIDNAWAGTAYPEIARYVRVRVTAAFVEADVTERAELERAEARNRQRLRQIRAL